jgi:hypothetical protein
LFFEKKKQKTFASLGAAYPGETAAKRPKVFCFFFSKKKALPSSRYHPSLDPGAAPRLARRRDEAG